MALDFRDMALRLVRLRHMRGRAWIQGRWTLWTGAFIVCFLSFVFCPPQLQDKFFKRFEKLQFWMISVPPQRLFEHISHLWVMVDQWVLGNLAHVESSRTFKYSLLWMAPFLSGGGYSSESLSYAEALVETEVAANLRIKQHGDSFNYGFFKGLPASSRENLVALLARDGDLSRTVVVCHSEPGAWYPPLFQTTPCPPSGYEEPLYVIGRTMFETDRVNRDHVERCNRMDEIWVPTRFHMQTFMNSGVRPSKLFQVPQIVDVDFFDPANTRRSRMPVGKCIRGACKERQEFVFLSIFKWEARKGWDILIKAYVQEFSVEDPVALYLLTSPYHMDRSLETVIEEFLKGLEEKKHPNTRPALYLLDQHIPQIQLPGLYKSADAFVLPSRGEGWGRPHVEAMAMGLPVLATNWSGMTEYMTQENSYPIPVAEMVEVMEGPFRGHLWAEPSLDSLQELMRRVMSDRSEARAKGAAARETMISKYSPHVVADQIVTHLARVQLVLDGKLQRDE